MNRLIALVIVVLAIGSISYGASSEPAQPFSASVPTQSVMVLPPRDIPVGAFTQFASGLIVTQGQVLQSAGGFWWVVTAGAVTNTPTATIGDVTSGSAVLRRVPIGSRTGLAIVNASTSTVYLAVGTAAVSGKGILLTTQGSSWSIDGSGAPQGAVYAVSAGGTNTISGVEW